MDSKKPEGLTYEGEAKRRFDLLAESIIESVDSSGLPVNWMSKQRYLDAVKKGISDFCTANRIGISFVDYDEGLRDGRDFDDFDDWDDWRNFYSVLS